MISKAEHAPRCDPEIAVFTSFSNTEIQKCNRFWGTLQLFRIIAFASLVIGAMPVTAQDLGPFGVTMGANPEDYGCEVQQVGAYKCATLPRSHPDVDFYLIVSEEGVGVCRVSALGNTITTNSRGRSLIDAVDKFRDQLIQSYGQPSASYDQLSSGSIWNEDEYWMMGLLKDDRTYAHFWTTGPYKADVQAARVAARALDSESGYVSVAFEFSNMDMCRDAQNAREASVF